MPKETIITKPKKDNIFIRFIKKILDPTQYTSIKSLAMFSSIIISFGLSICLGYSMVLDAWVDGILNMDLIDAGVFVTCLGSFMSIASIPKVLIDKIRANRGFPNMPHNKFDDEYHDEPEYYEDGEDETSHRKPRRRN